MLIQDLTSIMFLYRQHILSQHQRSVCRCVVDDTEKYIASASLDRNVIVWKVNDGSVFSKFSAKRFAILNYAMFVLIYFILNIRYHC